MQIKINNSKIKITNPIQAKHKLNSGERVFQRRNDDVLQPQIQNYFSLLHHIFGRNTSIKKILNQIQREKQLEGGQTFQLQMEDSEITSERDLRTIHKTENSPSLVENSRKKYSQNLIGFEYSRPKWKQSILRRKNNGSYGQIIKGTTKSKHNSLMERIEPVMINQQQECLKSTLTFNKQKFIPIGKIQQSKKIMQCKELSEKTTPTKRLNYNSYKKKINSKIKFNTLQRKSILKTECSQFDDGNVMSKTGYPLKISSDFDVCNPMKKLQYSPERYKSRNLSPCPWEVSQR